MNPWHTDPLADIPLAGDVAEALARRIGADRLARWVESKLGIPCGCPERQAKLNRIDLAARRFLGWLPREDGSP